MSLSPAARRWSALIDAYEASGLTQRAFAERRGLNPSTLAAWRSKLGRSSTSRPAAPRFAELVVSHEDPVVDTPSATPLVLHLRRQGLDLIIDPQVDLVRLRQVVEALC